MRGKFIHNRVLIARVEEAARARGAIIYKEYLIATRELEGYVDMVARYPWGDIVYEAENTLDRVHWDTMKARTLNARQLQIIFPNGHLARAAQKRVDELKASGRTGSLSILCLTVGAAVQLLKDSNGFDVGLNVPPTSIHQRPHRKPENSKSTAAVTRD